MASTQQKEFGSQNQARRKVLPKWPNTICRINGYDADAFTYYPVVIVGAGESGIAMGCRLKEALGFDQFRIFDRQAGVGGTWWVNRYPGVACDVPAIFYSFSFAPNPRWTTFFPTGPEIVKYLGDVCSKFQIADKIQCNTSVDGAKWLEAEEIWEVYLTHMANGTGDLSEADRQARVEKDGEQSVYLAKETIRAKILISAVGGLVDPKKWPQDIPGTESFEGQIFHSARWRGDVDFTDKNVVVLGTGCSSAQLVPEIIKPPFNAKSVTQIMRSPGWVIPRQLPPGGLERWERFTLFLGSEQLFKIFGSKEDSVKRRQALEIQLLEHLRNAVPKKYHDMLTPNYSVGCKRLVFDNKWLSTLSNQKVELTTQPLTRINPRSVTLGARSMYPEKVPDTACEEREVPADVIVQANGFETTKWLHPLKITGVGGKDLIDEMMARGGSQAYQGTALDGFPNFLMIFGPNTATGHSSVILATENMVEYALKFMKLVINGDARTFDVKREAEEAYTADIQKSLKSTVWHTGGCQSWYFDRENDWNSTVYPHSQVHFGWRCMFPTWSDWNIQYTRYGMIKRRLRQLLSIVVLLLTITGGYRFASSGVGVARLRNSLRAATCDVKGRLSRIRTL